MHSYVTLLEVAESVAVGLFNRFLELHKYSLSMCSIQTENGARQLTTRAIFITKTKTRTKIFLKN